MFSFLRKPAPRVISAPLPEPDPAPDSFKYIHPAATLFPMLHGVALGELAADIEAHGLREPIVRDSQERILDGRNRLRACCLAGVEPRYVEWDGQGSPVAFVLSRNLHRRHLNESQRSLVAARAKGMFEDEASQRRAERLKQNQPDDRKTPAAEGIDEGKALAPSVTANWQSRGPTAADQAADLMNVSPRSVARASKLIADGDEELLRAVETGTVTVSDAASISHLPKEQQRAALAAVAAGQARTLREASEIIGDLPPTGAASSEAEPDGPCDGQTAESAGAPKRAKPRRRAARPDAKLSPKRAAQECRAMEGALTKLTERVDRLDCACEEAKPHASRIRGGLQLARLAARECARALTGKG